MIVPRSSTTRLVGANRAKSNRSTCATVCVCLISAAGARGDDSAGRVFSRPGGQFQQGMDGSRRLFAAEDLPLAVDRLEKVAEPADRFRRAEEQQPARPQRVMENGQQPPLQFRVEIDQQVPADHQIELREGRILDDVLRGKDQRLPDLFADVVGVVLVGEVAFQPLLGDVGRDARRVDAGPGGLDRVRVQIRCRKSARRTAA